VPGQQRPQARHEADEGHRLSRTRLQAEHQNSLPLFSVAVMIIIIIISVAELVNTR